MLPCATTRPIILLLAVGALLLAGAAGAVEYSCKRLDGLRTIRVKDCELAPTPTPLRTATPTPVRVTPSPTPTPTPTPNTSCRDGNLSRVPGVKLLQLSRATFEPKREYRFCLNVPPDAAARIVTLQTRNYSNSSCGDLQTWLIAPSGVTNTSGGPQPGAGGRFEAGKWLIVLRLMEPCQKNQPFDLFFSWF